RMKEITRQHGDTPVSLSLIQPDPVTTDPQGRFTYPGLLPGWEYSLDAWAKGYARYSRALPEKAGPAQVLPDLVLPRADQVVAGVVVDRAGQPLAGVKIQPSYRQGPIW